MSNFTEVAGSSERLYWPQGHNMQLAASIPTTTEDGGTIPLSRLETWGTGAESVRPNGSQANLLDYTMERVSHADPAGSNGAAVVVASRSRVSRLSFRAEA